MKAAMVERLVDERLRSLFAAALADPDVDEHAKSLAGFLLQRLSEKGGNPDEMVPSAPLDARRS